MPIKCAWRCVLLTVLSVVGSGAHGDASIKVEVQGGAVVGKQVGDTKVFFGLPFAAPPVGDKRWKPPQPLLPWTGVRDSTKPAPACLQDLDGWNRRHWLHSSEDCLTLNVYTTELSGNKPVMVWVHGGANRAGGGGDLSGSTLLEQGVVLVDIQYRLGALGFLSHPELSAEQGGHSGNYAVMDQVAALEWVHRNIAQFGGDPGNVTIFGSSAGGLGVSMMLAAPTAQGLFHKAIMQSGNFRWTGDSRFGYRNLADAEKLGLQFAELADASNLDDLRNLSTVAIIDLQSKVDEPASGGMGFTWARVSIDGKVIPESPDTLVAKHAPKPVVIGTNKAEFGFNFEEDQALADWWDQWYGANGAAVVAAYNDEPADLRRGDKNMRLGSDAIFHCPADGLVEFLASLGWPVWRYEFDIGEDDGLTAHSAELPHVFGRREIGSGAFLQDYWAALAFAGDPNGRTAISTERPAWERWDSDNPRQMRFTMVDVAMEPGRPRVEFCALGVN